MRKKTFFVFMLLVVSLVVSGMVVSKSFADSAYQQAEQAGQSGEAAVQNSSDEGARHEAGTEKEIVITNTVVASAFDDKDQPCYAGGKHVGNCSQNKPYYNVFSGECYSTLKDCKKADGDLESVQANGGCVRCGK